MVALLWANLLTAIAILRAQFALTVPAAGYAVRLGETTTRPDTLRGLQLNHLFEDPRALNELTRGDFEFGAEVFEVATTAAMQTRAERPLARQLERAAQRFESRASERQGTGTPPRSSTADRLDQRSRDIEPFVARIVVAQLPARALIPVVGIP